MAPTESPLCQQQQSSGLSEKKFPGSFRNRKTLKGTPGDFSESESEEQEKPEKPVQGMCLCQKPGRSYPD